MDIIELLDEEIQAAKQALEDKKRADAERLRTEASEFKPVIAGLEQLESALDNREDIGIHVSTDLITVRLGNHITLETRRYHHSKEFTVEETATYELLGDTIEHTHHAHIFDNAENLLAFIVRKTAQYIVNEQA